jgi:hypothetical protein
VEGDTVNMDINKKVKKIEKYLPNLMSEGLLERERMDYRLRKAKKIKPVLVNKRLNELSISIENLKVDVNTIFEMSKRNGKK